MGVILDEDLDVGQHWEYRIRKAKSLLGKLDDVGSSKWGMSSLSWRQAFTAMIRSVASWGIVVGWRVQREWRVEMEKLQYAVLRNCTGTVVGARREYVRKVAVVESVEMFARASGGRFLACKMCDPSRAGVARCAAATLVGKGVLCLVGPCWRDGVSTVDIGFGTDRSSGDL